MRMVSTTLTYVTLSCQKGPSASLVESLLRKVGPEEATLSPREFSGIGSISISITKGTELFLTKKALPPIIFFAGMICVICPARRY